MILFSINYAKFTFGKFTILFKFHVLFWSAFYILEIVKISREGRKFSQKSELGSLLIYDILWIMKRTQTTVLLN